MKKSFGMFILVALIGLSGKVNAQIPTWLWGQDAVCSPGGGGEGMNVASDAFGNVYLVGYFNDTISFGSNTFYGTDRNHAFITKYNTNGDVLWSRNSIGGGSNGGVVYGVATDLAGNVFITGMFGPPSITFGTFTLTGNSNGWDFFVVKYDSSGNVLWAKGSSGEDQGNGITTDLAGNCYVVGYYEASSDTFGTHIITNLGGANIFITKYDQLGNALWAKSAGGSQVDEALGITSDSYANVFITGHIQSTVAHFGSDSITKSLPISNFFIAKYDSSGTAIWAKESIGNNISDGWSVSADPFGNVFSTGHCQGSIIFDTDTLQYSNNSSHVFVVKYDSSGDVLWAKAGVGNDAYFILSDSSGNAYFTSGSNSSDSVFTFDTITLHAPTGSPDPAYIIKINSSGNALFGFVLSSGADDNNAVALGPNGSIYFGGDFYQSNPFIFGPDSLIPTGSEAPFIAKLGFPIHVGINETKTIGNISVYPNPATTLLSIHQSMTTPNEQLIITDIMGTEVYKEMLTGIDNTISISTWSAGIYFYEVRSQNASVRGKFVKE